VELTELERACLSTAGSTRANAEAEDDWLRFCLAFAWEAGTRLRSLRLSPLREVTRFKEDGSPASLPEVDLERDLRARLAAFCPEATCLGEETGGEVAREGYAVAIDPVDGTWSFLSRTPTHATSLVVLRDGEPLVGLVSNPSTGEIAYATRSSGTRLVSLGVFGAPHAACALPLDRAQTDSVLVNVQPARRADHLVSALYRAWGQKDLSMVRSPGGAPVCGLLDAAKGSFVYVNLWGQRPSKAYDLSAGVLLVRQAGGEVVGLDGAPVSALDHRGPFVAAIEAEHRERVLRVVHEALT
jgi:fructose-1,6-bisphosphatase/inositol monophosphatase family enzyme